MTKKHYLLYYRQDKTESAYLLFSDTGSLIQRSQSRLEIYRNAQYYGINEIDVEIPSRLLNIIKSTYEPSNGIFLAPGGSILEESLQDNDQNPSHPSE